MKSKHKGTLYSLLARNYILFTMTLLLLGGGVYLLWDNYLAGAYAEDDWTALEQDANLEKGNYKRLKRYVRGNGSEIAVADKNYDLVYQSGSFFSDYTPGEIQCMPEFNGEYSLEVSYSDDGRTTCITEYTYSEETGYTEVGSMELDEQYRVVSGGLGDGRTEYTQREYQLLTQTYDAGLMLNKHTFLGEDGNVYILLMKSMPPGPMEYETIYQKALYLWTLLIPLYLITVICFIWTLNKKIRIPLEKLNRSVVAQVEGKHVHVGDCGGPREIRVIAESFDTLTDRLEESERERQKLNAQRQKMISDISHDLKTPITVISGYARTLADGKADPGKERQYLETICAKAESLTELINAFHEFSKVEHPDYTLHPVRTDICEYIRQYLINKYSEIELAGFSLEPEIPEESIWCQIDEMQMRRVLDNLISNSLRHNRLGTMLFVDVCRQEDSVVIRVADNGSGIPPERAKTIFDPFVVGNDARNTGGSGLGLSITRKIVELHGGTIVLSETPSCPRSTEFVITLPLLK